MNWRQKKHMENMYTMDRPPNADVIGKFCESISRRNKWFVPVRWNSAW